MPITRAYIDIRIAEVESEAERVLAETRGTYSGAIQELKRIRAELDAEDKTGNDA